MLVSVVLTMALAAGSINAESDAGEIFNAERNVDYYLNKQLEVGDVISAWGVYKDHTTSKFSVNIKGENGLYLLHVDFRPFNNVVVLNNYVNGWKTEIRPWFSKYNFAANKLFEVRIEVRQDGYHIFFNGNELSRSFPHRVDLVHADRVRMNGGSNGFKWTALKLPTTEGLTGSGVSFTTATREKNYLDRPLSVGDTITAWGIYATGSVKFSVNLMMENEEYFMIHVDFRPPPNENRVVLNSKKQNGWEREIRTDIPVFENGKTFRVDLKCLDGEFEIYHDGNVLGSRFPYRDGFALEGVKFVWLLGGSQGMRWTDLAVTQREQSSGTLTLGKHYTSQQAGDATILITEPTNLTEKGFDNTMSRYKIDGDELWFFYDSPNFEGLLFTAQGPIDWTMVYSQFNDRVSSVRVEQQTPATASTEPAVVTKKTTEEEATTTSTTKITTKVTTTSETETPEPTTTSGTETPEPTTEGPSTSETEKTTPTTEGPTTGETTETVKPTYVTHNTASKAETESDAYTVVGPTELLKCKDDEFTCKERCIDLSWRCDGEVDCLGKEDEQDCGSSCYGNTCTVLTEDLVFEPEQKLVADNKEAYLTLEKSGNLVLYCENGEVAWQSGTKNEGYGNVLIIQKNGDLVLYGDVNRETVVWQSGAGSPPTEESYEFQLVVEDDNNLVLYNEPGGVLWQTDTVYRCGKKTEMR